MGKANFWKTDWFFGLVVSLVVLGFAGGELLQSLERKAYDLGMGMTSRAPSDRIAVIAIDKQSLDNIGRWPWSRDVLADMVEKLAAAKAKVIGTTILFSEPQLDPGLAYINKLIELYTQAGGLPATAAPEELAAQNPLLAQMADAAVRGRAETQHRPPPGRGHSPRPAMSCCRCCSASASRRGVRTGSCRTSSRRMAVKPGQGETAPIPTSNVDALVVEIAWQCRRGHRPPQRHSRRRWRHPHRAAGADPLRPDLSGAVADDRGEEPQPDACRHPGASGRVGASSAT